MRKKIIALTLIVLLLIPNVAYADIVSWRVSVANCNVGTQLYDSPNLYSLDDINVDFTNTFSVPIHDFIYSIVEQSKSYLYFTYVDRDGKYIYNIGVSDSDIFISDPYAKQIFIMGVDTVYTLTYDNSYNFISGGSRKITNVYSKPYVSSLSIPLTNSSQTRSVTDVFFYASGNFVINNNCPIYVQLVSDATLFIDSNPTIPSIPTPSNWRDNIFNYYDAIISLIFGEDYEPSQDSGSHFGGGHTHGGGAGRNEVVGQTIRDDIGTYNLQNGYYKVGYYDEPTTTDTMLNYTENLWSLEYWLKEIYNKLCDIYTYLTQLDFGVFVKPGQENTDSSSSTGGGVNLFDGIANLFTALLDSIASLVYAITDTLVMLIGSLGDLLVSLFIPDVSTVTSSISTFQNSITNSIPIDKSLINNWVSDTPQVPNLYYGG